MTDLNEYECEMLDTMLEAFGIPDGLTRLQLLELFDQDESTAFAMVQALTLEGLVAESGKHGDFELPEKLILKSKSEKFLRAGGFTMPIRQSNRNRSLSEGHSPNCNSRICVCKI